MRRKKSIRVISLFIIFSLVLFQVAFADDIPKHTSSFYVNDFANILSDKEENILMDRALELYQSTNGTQVVVTTVKNLNGKTVEYYANKMYNEYGIGKDSMGVLVLISVEDRKIRVEVGRTMQTYITDAQAAKLMKTYGIPLLKENKFAEGLISLQEAVINHIKVSIGSISNNEEQVEISGATNDEIEDSKSKLSSIVLGILLLAGPIILMVHTCMICMLQEEKKRRYQKTWYSGGMYSSNASYSPLMYDSSSSSKNNSSSSDSSFDFAGDGGCSDGGGASGDF